MDKKDKAKILNKIKLPFLKRFFDVVFSLFVIIVLLPVFVLIFFGLIIEHLLRRVAPMPFFSEIRITEGKLFELIKFNPFRPNLVRKFERENKFFYAKQKEHNHKNLTYLGIVIQHLYLDELPQLFLILAGKMTLVGPRPVNEKVHSKLTSQNIYNKDIFRAGLSGTYQICKGVKGVDQHVYDREYIEFVKNNSAFRVVWLDLTILARTVLIMLKAKGL